MKSTLLMPEPRIDVAAEMTLLEVLSLAETLKDYERRGDMDASNAIFVRSLQRLEVIALTTPEDRARVVLADARIQKNAPHLRRIAAHAEGLAEKFHAKASILKTIPTCSANATPAEKINILSTLLENYHRAHNYVKTVWWELKLFKDMPLTADSRVAFTGSGSVPLTPLLLHVSTNAAMTCIENDSEAVMLSRKLIDRLEKAGVVQKGKIEVVFGDAQHFNYRDHETVFIASLIPNEAKGNIAGSLGNTRKDPARLTIRSGGDLVQLLYENVDPAMVAREHLKLQAELRPFRRGEAIEVTKINQEPGRVRTIVGDSEIFNSTQLYLANMGDLPGIPLRARVQSETNWSDKSSKGFDPRSIGSKAK